MKRLKEMEICKHYRPNDTKACCFYEKTTTPKIGLCKFQYKLTFLCHYSEKFKGIYTADAEIIKSEELNNQNK